MSDHEIQIGILYIGLCYSDQHHVSVDWDMNNEVEVIETDGKQMDEAYQNVLNGKV